MSDDDDDLDILPLGSMQDALQVIGLFVIVFLINKIPNSCDVSAKNVSNHFSVKYYVNRQLCNLFSVNKQARSNYPPDIHPMRNS